MNVVRSLFLKAMKPSRKENTVIIQQMTAAARGGMALRILYVPPYLSRGAGMSTSVNTSTAMAAAPREPPLENYRRDAEGEGEHGYDPAGRADGARVGAQLLDYAALALRSSLRPQ